MKRRDFITLLGGAAAWPLAVRAGSPHAHDTGASVCASVSAARCEISETGSDTELLHASQRVLVARATA